ncbi:MAG: hypothetical protein EPN34_13815 [Burkholderiaceae bacterium]|nr:MAG: hypothetical protein EPN34_13815 [Burkholderiaceae bacterium]
MDTSKGRRKPIYRRPLLLGFIVLVALVLTTSQPLRDSVRDLACGVLGCNPSESTLQESTQQSMQEFFDKSDRFKSLQVHVGDVRLIHKAGNEYEGRATLALDGQTHSVEVNVLADGKNILWKIPPGDLMFIAQNQISNVLKALQLGGSAQSVPDAIRPPPDAPDMENDSTQAPANPNASPAATPTPAVVARPSEVKTGPSFDCARGTWLDERTICGNAHLAFLDSTLAGTFAKELKAGNPSATRRKQLAWLEKRHACGDNVPCIERMYVTRINDLGGVDGRAIQ